MKTIIFIVVLVAVVVFFIAIGYAVMAIAQKADDADRALNDDGSCNFCGHFDGLTCKECKAQKTKQ